MVRSVDLGPFVMILGYGLVAYLGINAIMSVIDGKKIPQKLPPDSAIPIPITPPNPTPGSQYPIPWGSDEFYDIPDDDLFGSLLYL